MKAFKFDVKNLLPILGFLVQFKIVCNLNAVSEGIALWSMPTYIEYRPEFCIKIQMTSHKEDRNTNRRLKTLKEQNSLYVEAMNLLLKIYATNSNITNSTTVRTAEKGAQRKNHYSPLVYYDQKSYIGEAVIGGIVPRQCSLMAYQSKVKMR